MTVSKKSAAQKKAAAEAKADEIAALMGDSETAESAKEVPPAVEKTPDSGPTELEPFKTEANSDKEPETATDSDSTVIEEGVNNADQDSQTDSEVSTSGSDEGSEEDAKDEELEDDEDDEAVVVSSSKTLHILTKTMHTKCKDGKDVKFLASSKPQDLGEYGDLAVKAGLAKVHKAS